MRLGRQRRVYYPLIPQRVRPQVTGRHYFVDEPDSGPLGLSSIEPDGQRPCVLWRPIQRVVMRPIIRGKRRYASSVFAQARGIAASPAVRRPIMGDVADPASVLYASALVDLVGFE